MTSSPDAFAPYAPIQSVLTVIRRLRERGLPEVLTLQELARVGVTEGNASRTLQALKYLGLVDPEGRRTAEFDGLRRASPDEYPQALGAVVRAAYREVFAIADPAQDSEVEISNAFRSFKPEAQMQRMVALFMGLCREAQLVMGGSPERAPRKPRQSNAKQTVGHTPPPTSKSPPGIQAPIVLANLPDYSVLDTLFRQLPKDGKWTRVRRDTWLQMVKSALDWSVKLMEDMEPLQLLPGPSASIQSESSGSNLAEAVEQR